MADVEELELLNTEILCCDDASIDPVAELYTNNVDELRFWCQGDIGVEKVCIFFVVKNQELFTKAAQSGVSKTGVSRSSGGDFTASPKKQSGALTSTPSLLDTPTVDSPQKLHGKPLLFEKEWVAMCESVRDDTARSEDILNLTRKNNNLLIRRDF